MTRWVSRTEWEAAAPTRQPRVISASARRGIVFHWNGPPLKLDTGRSPDALLRQEISKARALQRYQQGKGWSDLAYSYLVGQSGAIFVVRDLWDQFANGADDVGVNDGADSVWFTVMWMGGEGEKPTFAALDALAELVSHVRQLGAGNRVLPHLDFKHKTCPGPDLTAVARRWDRQPLPLEDTDMTPEQARLLEQIAEKVNHLWEVTFQGGPDLGPGRGKVGPLADKIHQLHARKPAAAAGTSAAEVVDEVAARLSKR